MRQHTQWRWHLDEVYVRVHGEMRFLCGPWTTKARCWSPSSRRLGASGRTEVNEEADEAARLRQDHHHRWVALLPRSHERARHRGPAGGQPLGNYRVENSHQPFRRRERAMPRFRRMKTLQQFASTHSAFHNYFNQERHLVSREIYRERRLAALAEWRQVVG